MTVPTTMPQSARGLEVGSDRGPQGFADHSDGTDDEHVAAIATALATRTDQKARIR